jgi:DnaJ-class molecular chaperone
VSGQEFELERWESTTPCKRCNGTGEQPSWHNRCRRCWGTGREPEAVTTNPYRSQA